MKILLLLILANTPTFIFSQSPIQQWEWARSFGGTGTDSARDIKIKNGFLYVAGTFTSPQINWDNTSLINAGGKDIFIAKLDTTGKTIWVESFGGPGDEEVLQLEVNNNGDAAIWCTSSGNSIVIGSKTLTNPANFYIKVNEDGNLLNSNKQPSSCEYQDFDIGDDGSVYFSGKYFDVFNFAGQVADTTNGNTGCFIFKYNAGGSEGWAKYIVLYNNPNYPFDPANYAWDSLPPNMRIEYSGFDNTLAFLCEYYHKSAPYYNITTQQFEDIADLSHLGNVGTFQANYPKDKISGKLSDTSLIYLSRAYPIGGSFNGYVFDFETGNSTGLSFSYYREALLSGTRYYVRKDFDSTRQVIRSWTLVQNVYDTGDVVNIAAGTLRTGEKATYVLFNSDNATNNLEILDTNLVSKKLISIPAFGQQTWLNKSLTDANAVYFADSYYNASVQLNNNITGANVIPIQNNGLCNIFIGKYNIHGNPGITLLPSPDRFRICSDSVSLNLGIASGGTGPLTYRWKPASIVSDSTILNPKVFTTADSVIATLTITDTTGKLFTKDFTFFKGSVIDLRLIPSDTIACRGDTITLSLAGTQFIPCYYSAYGGYIYTPIFNSITDTQKYIMRADQKLTLYPYNDPSVPPSQYCIASAVQISTSKSLAAPHVTICQGGSYTFPNGNQAVYVRHPIVYTCTINSAVVCDSIITTYLDIDTLPVVNELRKVCRGASFIFPDGWTIPDVEEDMTYTSYLHSSSGCDTMTITTYLQVINAVDTVQDTVICKGSTYTFPDDSTFTNIQSTISHISHIKSVFGCDSTITTNIMLYPLNQSAQNVTVCAGASYTFANDTTINDITSALTHTSHFTSINGCDSSIVYNVSVVSIDTSVTKNGRTLTANFTNGDYQWLNCTTAYSAITDSVNQSFTPSFIGDYAVKITGQGCIDTSSCYSVTATDLGLGGTIEVNIYPVPSKNTFKVTIKTRSYAAMNLVLYDFQGNRIHSTTVSLPPGINTVSQNISSLANGTYTLRLINTQTGETITKRIIKN